MADGRALKAWTRFALRLWGPADIGRIDTPRPPIDPDPDCPFCGHAESEHLRFTTADRKSLRRCPAVPAATA